MTTTTRTVTLEAAGGARIAARLFLPVGAPRTAIVIGGAMGVVQEFYRPFAEWLAGEGHAVATFDYRGMGLSRPERFRHSLRGFDADLHDWAADFDAAIVALRQAAPGVPLHVIGHSLGAQLPGMLAHRDCIDGLVSVAAGSGYWRDNAWRTKRVTPYFWWLLVPLATRLYGYFPGKRMRKIGDVPRGVMLQWRRWCLHPKYHVGAEGAALAERFEAARFPLVALSITDDELMTERGTRVLVNLYAAAPRRIERIAPEDVGAKAIGHFGFFRDRFQSTLWTRAKALVESFQPHPLKETTT